MDIQPLATVCKHLRDETRDETVIKLSKQKHAAHAKCYRLQLKVKQLELTTRILAACWASATKHNEALNAKIAEIVKQHFPE